MPNPATQNSIMDGIKKKQSQKDLVGCTLPVHFSMGDHLMIKALSIPYTSPKPN